MRSKIICKARIPRNSKKEPLADGLQITVPTDSRGRRLWSKMSDDEVVEFAKKKMKESAITGKTELGDFDCSLYMVLMKRKLLNNVGFEEKQRSWKDISDEEIIDFAKRVVEEHSITAKGELNKIDSGLYSVLSKRKLLDKLRLDVKHRSWNELTNDEILELVKRLMKENEIVARHGLCMADSGLYSALRKRGLLDEVGFAKNRTKMRSWKDMSDEEILELAIKVRLESGISGRHEFEKTDPRLYRVLKERKLLDDVGFEEKQRSWKGLSDEQIVEFAKKTMEEKEITGRNELAKADSVLYSILQRRKLIDRAFTSIDQQKTDQARDAVIDALEAFAANDNNSAEDDVA